MRNVCIVQSARALIVELSLRMTQVYYLTLSNNE